MKKDLEKYFVLMSKLFYKLEIISKKKCFKVGSNVGVMT